jgi:mRNA interferase YafQ
MRLARSTSQFRRSLKKILKSGRYSKNEIQKVVDVLILGKTLDEKYKDHSLHGELSSERGCHVYPDLIIVYRIENNNLVLVFVDIGSHSDLF